MSYIIVSIHGLSNKPEAKILEAGCKDAIREGLKRNLASSIQDIKFKSVYWADLCYPDSPLNPDLEPYVAAIGSGPLRTYRQGKADALKASLRGIGGTVVDLAKLYVDTRTIADIVLKAKLEDLYKYYSDQQLREKLRARLREVLVEVGNTSRIMLIAHSMGSIIAYDVLREIGKTNPYFKLDHFVTLGSPLGLPQVKGRIVEEHGWPRTPSVVYKWSNFADKRDPVAFDAHLADDYEPNDMGIEVKDDLVLNEYIGNKKGHNPHKIYGYLRAPEVSEVIQRFL